MLNARAVKDIDEQPKPIPAGFSLGAMPPPSNQSAQLSLAIGNNQNQPAMVPELKRGGDLEDKMNQIQDVRGRGGPDPDEDEDFDQKGTSRNINENAMFNKVCSMILDDFLYLGSDIVAQDYDLLQQNKITHVVNCAADYSADYHIEKGMKYLSLHLKDHVRENIECSFYDVIEFMKSAKQEGGRVYIHCV